MVVVYLAACQSSTPQPAPASCKPEAPIAIEIATRTVGIDELEVTARAVPTKQVASVELALALPAHAHALGIAHTRFGDTAAGEARTLTTRVQVDQRTAEITAIARVPVAEIEMSRTSTIAIGVAAPAERTRTYALPDGELAREVRP